MIINLCNYYVRKGKMYVPKFSVLRIKKVKTSTLYNNFMNTEKTKKDGTERRQIFVNSERFKANKTGKYEIIECAMTYLNKREQAL